MHVDLFEYSSYQKFLSDELVERKKNNTSYSTRAFSRDLQISVSALSKVLNYKKGLSASSASKIADSLTLGTDEKKYLIALVNSQTEKNDEFKLESASYVLEHGSFVKRKLLPDTVLTFLSDWYAILIFSALEIKRLQSDTLLISKTLGIPRGEVERVLSVLLKNKIIRIEGDHYLKNVESIEFSSDTPSALIQQFHRNQLKKAEQLLITDDSIENRFFQSVNFHYDDQYKDEIKDKIKTFIDEMSSYQKLGTPNSLITVNTQALFFSVPDIEKTIQ